MTTPPQETLFDLPFGVDVTDLTPTIVRHLLTPSRSSRTGSVLDSETEVEEENTSGDDEDDEDDVVEVTNNLKRKAGGHLECSRVNKKGRVS